MLHLSRMSFSRRSANNRIKHKKNLFKGSLFFLSFGLPLYSFAAVPSISSIAEQNVNKGQTLKITPQLNQSNDSVNWSIAYGPDAVEIKQGTGEITWSIPSNIPTESFYIGVKASNAEGSDIQYFIVHVGVPNVVHVGPSYPVKTLGVALRDYEAPGNQYRTPGTTFVVENGTYSTQDSMVGLTPDGIVQVPPAGNANAYTTIMAETPGGVEFNNGATISLHGGVGDPHYMAVKGFFVNGRTMGVTGHTCGSDTACVPHHIKFEANGIYLTNSQGFGATYAHDILFENNYSFGGLRTKVSFYHTDRVIARRNVARFDWVTDNPGPQNTYSFYASTNSLAQNNIAVDSDAPYFWQPAEDGGEFACPVTNGSSQVEFVRNIQLNSAKSWGNMDDQNTDRCIADLDDNVSWDTRPYAAHVAARGSVDINHMTIGNIHMLLPNTWLVNGFPQNTRGFRNSIIHDVNTANLFYDFGLGTTETILGQVFNRTGVNHINVSSTSANINYNDESNNFIDMESVTHLDPMYSLSNPQGSIKYIVRTEKDSNLSNKGDDNKTLGATVMTFKGASGTMWGQSGYNQETGRPAWPFPLQEVIQAKMAAMNYKGNFYAGDGSQKVLIGTANLSGQRGFAVPGKDLTHYIWGYLGNAVPPLNVTAQTDGSDTIVRWDKAPSSYASGITGFKVYDYNPNTGEASNPRDVSANATQMLVTGSGGNMSYVVTAIHSTKGESGYSYPSTGSFVAVANEDEAEATATKPVLLAPHLEVIEVQNTQ